MWCYISYLAALQSKPYINVSAKRKLRLVPDCEPARMPAAPACAGTSLAAGCAGHEPARALPAAPAHVPARAGCAGACAGTRATRPPGAGANAGAGASAGAGGLVLVLMLVLMLVRVRALHIFIE